MDGVEYTISFGKKKCMLNFELSGLEYPYFINGVMLLKILMDITSMYQFWR